MARIRTIKPEFWTDETIISLPLSARLFFIGLWNFADDYGALQDKPEQLKLLIIPSENEIDAFNIIDLLISCGLIDRYADIENDKTYLLIKNWSIHQKVDHPAKSRIITENGRKAVVTYAVRKSVAEKYKCLPGEDKDVVCFFCGTPGKIYWQKPKSANSIGWISTSLEFSHVIPESKGGETKDDNIVLCCRNCNRSMGVKNAFEWLFNNKWRSKSLNLEIFRDNSREFEKTLEPSLTKGEEGKGYGMEGRGGDAPSHQSDLFDDAEKEILANQIEFERICMNAKSKNIIEAKKSLRKFHLHLQQNDKYPMKRKQMFAGFEKWLLNEKDFKLNGNGTHKRTAGEKPSPRNEFEGNSKHL